MKRLLKIIVLSVIATVCAFSAAACSSGDKATGEKGLLKKMFSGDDYYTVYSYVKENDEKDVTLDIGEYNKDGVVIGRIKAGAFKDNDSIVKLIIPATVTKIDAGAFANMKALEEIVLPFVGETAVADLYFNSADYSLRENASVGQAKNFGVIFGTEEYEGGVKCTQNYSASDTATYYLPETLVKASVMPAEEYGIPMYAFSGNTKIRTLALSENVKYIGENAFKDNKYLKNVNLEKVTTVYDNAFNGAKDVLAADLSACENLGVNSFSGAANLKEVKVNCAIKADTFYNCAALKTLYLLDGVNKIGARAFYGCDSLTAVTVAGENIWKVNGAETPTAAILNSTLQTDYNNVWER